MRTVKPVLAFLCLSLLSGCGGGSSNAPVTTGGTGITTGSSGASTGAVSVATPIISPTFSQSNTGPGVESGAGASSGTGGSTPISATVSVVNISPAGASLEVNRRITLTALGADAGGNLIVVPAENWKWTSSNPSVAVLTSQGATATISGVSAGTVIITAFEGSSHVVAQIPISVTAVGSSTGSSPGGSGLGGDTGGSGGTTGGTGGTTGGTGGTTGGTVVYANDFANGAGAEWSNTHVEKTPGTAKHASTPFLGQFGPEAVKLNLKDLVAHTSATIEFDLFIIRSMDGSAAIPGIGPDIWDLSIVGGPTLLHTTFSNISPVLASNNPGFTSGMYSNFQSFPDNYPSGDHLNQTGTAEYNTLGFPFEDSTVDAVYHLKYTFPHNASTIILNFKSNQTQDKSDESWGLKNVKLTLNP